MEIDEHVGCAMSGLTADARTLVEHGRVETQVLFLSSLQRLCEDFEYLMVSSILRRNQSGACMCVLWS